MHLNTNLGPARRLRRIPVVMLALLLVIALFTSVIIPLASARAANEVTAYDLIVAMNTLRVSNGLPALVEDPIIDSVAQATADIMAANNMSSHIGDVSGRLAAAGYGGGAKVWGTENFAVGQTFGLDQIMLVWSDAAHMIPAVNPAYCNIGAGVSKSDSGRTYYVLQAAYTSAKSCGEYKSVGGGTTTQPGGGVTGVSQIIIPVKLAKPDKDGRIYHDVKSGQSLWAIAIAYKITIADIEKWNNINRATPLKVGQKLFIPGPNTEGYATPTPAGMIQVSQPDVDGRVIHTVQAYNTLITIAQAYRTSVDKIVAYNGWPIDRPLQIGQKLIISPGNFTPSPTPRPLTPIEKLTPEPDGNYYHTVRSGETLSGISRYYGIALGELMAWNGLNTASVIHPGQKLVLQVTPPATDTPPPPPATDTPEVTPDLETSTPTQTALAPDITATPKSFSRSGFALPVERRTLGIIIFAAAILAVGLMVVGFMRRGR